jgi:hypothetical protein
MSRGVSFGRDPVWRRLAAGVLALLAGAVPGTPLAQEWSASGFLRQQFDYDDNIGLNSLEISDGSSTSTAQVGFQYRGANTYASLTGRFNFIRFFSEETLNSDDQFVFFNASHRLGRNTFRLTAEADFDTTRTSEIDDNLVGILANEPRQLYRITPLWDFQWSPVDLVSVFFDFRLERFPTGVFLNNETYSGAVAYSRRLSEWSQALGVVTVSHYEDDGSITDSVDVVGGLEGNITQNWTGRFVAGPRFSHDRPDGGGTDSSVGATFEASTIYEFSPRTSVEASFSQGLVPSADAGTQNRTEARAVFRHQLLSTLLFELFGRFDLREEAFGTDTDSREFASIEPVLSWEFYPDWEVGARYRFRWNAPANTDDSFTSNAFLVTLTYRTPRWFVWR